MPVFIQNTARTETALLFLCVLGLNLPASGADEELTEALAVLEKQNALLMQLVQNQQFEIDTLKQRLNDISSVTDRQSEKIEALEESDYTAPFATPRPSLGNSVHISGEAGIIFRAGEANTNFPNEEFRVDEARLFIDAQISEGVYLFSELNLFSRESNNPDFQIGELYVELEEILTIGEWNRALNLRLGRLDVPFGEEYQSRDVMENPLISHSIADFWGIDEGIEAFGELGDVSYVLAVQNGSVDILRDHTSSKSITVRIGLAPLQNLRISGSVMRTGNIDVKNDRLTELWFGNGFFRSIGSPSTTSFDVDLAQLDASYSWQTGHIGAAYGNAWYGDNDPNQENKRDLDFWHIEVQQGISENVYAAIRYSGMNAHKGYPVSGMASRGRFFFGPTLTEELRRLSFGITYWPYSDVVFKLDYTMEDGEHPDGSKRTDSDMFSAEAGVRF